MHMLSDYERLEVGHTGDLPRELLVLHLAYKGRQGSPHRLNFAQHGCHCSLHFLARLKEEKGENANQASPTD